MLWFPNKRTAFWQWFQQHEQELFTVNLHEFSEQHPLQNALCAVLGRVAKGLAYQLGKTVDGRRELVISADGNMKLFPEVIALVDTAPPLPRWDVLKFRPRVKEMQRFAVRIGDITLRQEGMSFIVTPHEDERRVGIVVFLHELDSEQDEVRHCVFIHLDSTLGEYDMETKVGMINIFPLAKTSDLAEMDPARVRQLQDRYGFDPTPHPFAKLPDEFDRMYAAVTGGR